MPTNFQKWREFCRDLPSPDNYIDWGYYYMVAACLQRRVWVGSASQPLFPNIYVILVGPPGTGKGLVIRPVTEFIRWWKLFDVVGTANGAKSSEDKQQIEMEQKAQFKEASEKEFQGKGQQAKETMPPLLFPQASDSTSYQALINALGDAQRGINYYQYNPVTKKDEIKTYRHSSMNFCLQELASLLRAKTEDTVNFLLGLYDCPLDYEYTTITRGKDRLRRACVNILAGTTPSYMQSTFDSKIVDEGFSSRTFYVCARKNRKNVIRIPGPDAVQQQYKKDILDHLKNLSFLYGSVHIEESTWAWLESWWDNYEKNRHLRANKSPKLEAYYSRKQIHVIKLAMLMHFGEVAVIDPKMPIPLERFQEAIAFLEREELNMHLALTLEGNTPMGRATKFALQYLESGRKKHIDLYCEIWKILGNKDQSNQCIDFLLESGQICPESEKDERTDKETIYYRLI